MGNSCLSSVTASYILPVDLHVKATSPQFHNKRNRIAFVCLSTGAEVDLCIAAVVSSSIGRGTRAEKGWVPVGIRALDLCRVTCLHKHLLGLTCSSVIFISYIMGGEHISLNVHVHLYSLLLDWCTDVGGSRIVLFMT